MARSKIYLKAIAALLIGVAVFTGFVHRQVKRETRTSKTFLAYHIYPNRSLADAFLFVFPIEATDWWPITPLLAPLDHPITSDFSAGPTDILANRDYCSGAY